MLELANLTVKKCYGGSLDHISPAKRSWNMGQIRDKNTAPERIVRSLLHRLGFRFRLNRRNLPGKPDIVLPKYKTVIFVHGCFWHRHKNCKRASTPKSNLKYWEQKFLKNIQRDCLNASNLKDLGWKIVIVWECETKDTNSLAKHLLDEIKAGSD